jgi:hypothetical protein
LRLLFLKHGLKLFQDLSKHEAEFVAPELDITRSAISRSSMSRDIKSKYINFPKRFRQVIKIIKILSCLKIKQSSSPQDEIKHI